MNLFIIIAVWLSLAGPAWAISPDASSGAAFCSACSTTTHNHTFGPDSVGLICVLTRDATAPVAVSTLTVDGAGATFILGKSNTNNQSRSELWRYTNTGAAATRSVAVTLASAASAGLSTNVQSFTGVDTTTPVDASNSAASSVIDTTPTVTVTTTVDKTLVVDCVHDGDNALLTVGAGQEIRWQRFFNTGTNNDSIGISSEYGATAGNVTMSWTAGATDHWVTTAAALRSTSISGCRLLQNGTDKRLVQNGTIGRILQAGGDCGFAAAATFGFKKLRKLNEMMMDF